MALLTITRKLLGETRWSLAISTLAFFGLAMLWNWGVSEYQFPTEDPEEARSNAEVGGDRGGGDRGDDRPEQRRRRRAGPQIYVFFGVPAERIIGVDREEAPTLAMQVAMGNHPLVFLALLGWAISRASAAVAGEIERGTLDLTLSRPVRRSTYLASQILATVLAFLILGLAIAGGHLAAPSLFRLNASPGLAAYLPMIAMLTALGLAVFGYTLVVSACDLSRARAGIVGLGVTLGGIAAMIFARQYEEYDWAANGSVFEYYAPVGFTVDRTEDQLVDLGILLGIFGVGSLLAFIAFLRRDLPSNSG